MALQGERKKWKGRPAKKSRRRQRAYKSIGKVTKQKSRAAFVAKKITKTFWGDIFDLGSRRALPGFRQGGRKGGDSGSKKRSAGQFIGKKPTEISKRKK